MGNSGIKILNKKVSTDELKKYCRMYFSDMVKASVDIEKGVIALGGYLHSDSEEILIEKGSDYRNIWGINIYPFRKAEERIEYVALINIKPELNNLSMEIADKEIKRKIKNIVNEYVLGDDEILV